MRVIKIDSCLVCPYVSWKNVYSEHPFSYCKKLIYKNIDEYLQDSKKGIPEWCILDKEKNENI